MSLSKSCKNDCTRRSRQGMLVCAMRQCVYARSARTMQRRIHTAGKPCACACIHVHSAHTLAGMHENMHACTRSITCTCIQAHEAHTHAYARARTCAARPVREEAWEGVGPCPCPCPGRAVLGWLCPLGALRGWRGPPPRACDQASWPRACVCLCLERPFVWNYL